MEVEGPKRLSVNVKGPAVVTAADISDSAGIEVLNKEHVICHLDDGADLYMELTVNTGKGYVPLKKTNRRMPLLVLCRLMQSTLP